MAKKIEIPPKTRMEMSVELMFSESYKDRFIAEYYQLSERLTKLGAMLRLYAVDELSFEPSCPFDLLRDQYITMRHYLDILKERASIEHINLPD